MGTKKYLQEKLSGTTDQIVGFNSDGEAVAIDKGSVGVTPTIQVTTDTGATVVGTCGSISVIATETSTGVYTINCSVLGTWTVTATKSGKTSTKTVEVTEVTIYPVSLSFSSIYGVSWDGTSTTVWSRTDAAQNFTNPVPYMSGMTAAQCSSPFDDIMPWSGMVRVTDSVAGEMIAIPKFWYKWTRSGNTMKLQISNGEESGFNVSPAHADRGGGKGEQDTVWVGRYHCSSSNYKSVTGASPKVNITRDAARQAIKNLGSGIYQYDFAMYWTICMLYLVEFANWNSQACIGYGCGNNSGVQNVGASDSMPYHTGTMQSSRTTYGVGVQYRYIEGLWDNVLDWCDGIYFSSANVYCIKNPANFSDTSGGTLVGTRATSSNYISAWTNPTVSGFEYALYPNAVSGSDSTYVTDSCYYYASGVVLRVGGDYGRDLGRGLFYLSGNYAASNSYGSIGCRLMRTHAA